MAYDINSITIAGRLVRDPELAQTKNGKTMCKFSIASNKGNDIVAFFNVVTWDKTASNCGQYLKKGSQVIINGRMDQNKYQDKNGQNRTSFFISANNVQFIGGNSGGSQQQAKPQMPNIQPANPPQQAQQPDQHPFDFDNIPSDDVPF
jgi:single-strand DNA-binding protein